MNIKTNLRAGSGGASGAGKNSTSSSTLVYWDSFTGTYSATIPASWSYPNTRCVGV
jgi:hypothetical protein